MRWRGSIHFVPYGDAKSYAVNHVGIEQYLYGVVPRESPSSWPAEALKAQAVAARSYAYEDARTGKTLYCTTKSQVYAGYSRPGTVLEVASTNAAVDGTTGRVVWYGTETAPVKTFFSSCSGGHTASIQDVWVSSTPKPYYVGVADADTASPDYRWGPVGYSDATLASKLRAYDTNGGGGLDFSAPSPYVVSTLTLERASSGYVHHLTVKWSNGQSFRVPGTTLQSALGLKSSKYWITKSGTAGTLVTYQQADSRLAWVGPWHTARNADASRGSYAYTAYTSSQCVVRFTGTGVKWIGNRGPAYGMAEVWLDGVKVATVNQYSSKGARRITHYARTGLASGQHRLMIKAIRRKNSRSSGYSCSVDRIDVINGGLLEAETPVSAYQQNHARVALLGDWKESTSTAVSGGSHGWSLETGDVAVVDFFGSAFRWYGSRSSSYGSARVTIDGGTPHTVDLNSTSPLNQQLLFQASTSPSAAHHAVIQVLGPPSGGLGVVSVDRIDIVGGWLLDPRLPLKRVEDGSALLATTGAWSPGVVAGTSGGHHSISGTAAGSTMTLRFDGARISWIATKSKAYGKAAVIIDGTAVATVDLYSATKATKQVVFARSLSRGDHTITVKTLGTKNASSTGTYVTVDAFDVSGLALPPL